MQDNFKLMDAYLMQLHGCASVVKLYTNCYVAYVVKLTKWYKYCNQEEVPIHTYGKTHRFASKHLVEKAIYILISEQFMKMNAHSRA